jgi:hypothetical protein
MPTYKVLGQLFPSSSTLTTLYTAPSQVVASTLSVCNQGPAATSFRVAVRPGGETVSQKHYVAYDTPVNAYDSVFLTLGMTLSGSDAISVYAATSSLSFNLFGTEI